MPKAAQKKHNGAGTINPYSQVATNKIRTTNSIFKMNTELGYVPRFLECLGYGKENMH